MPWIGISSANLHSFCGEEGAGEMDDALDGVDRWRHATNHDHWFILDLGATYNVTRIRGRSLGTFDPIDVDLYVGPTAAGPWGAAVAVNIVTWQDTAVWVTIDTTDKVGKFVYVVILDTESGLRSLIFGRGAPLGFTIIDVEGDLVATPGSKSSLMAAKMIGHKMI